MSVYTHSPLLVTDTVSGIRVAKEVVEAMNVSLENNDESIDKLMPMSMFRYLNPKKDTRCCLCHKAGMRIREGNLLVFRKGTRQMLVHTNCAENSPEVEVFEGQWKSVFTTVNRSRTFECTLCSLTGASIGCAHPNCNRCYHFSCGEDTGWRFEVDGKEFYCDLHRTFQKDRSESVRVSIRYFQSKCKKDLVCALCDEPGDTAVAGDLLAFQCRVMGNDNLVLVHENCLRNTSIIDIGEEKMSHLDKEFRNVFTAVDRARSNKCPVCMKSGASVLCGDSTCTQCFHVPCAAATGWKFDQQGLKFHCTDHRNKFAQSYSDTGPIALLDKKPSLPNGKPGDTDGTNHNGKCDLEYATDDDDSEVPEVTMSIFKELTEETAWMPADIPLTPHPVRRRDSRWVPKLVRLARRSLRDRWNVDLFATCLDGSLDRVLTIAAATTTANPVDPLEEGDIVRAINGVKVGSKELHTLGKVVAFLGREVELILDIHRRQNQENPWI